MSEHEAISNLARLVAAIETSQAVSSELLTLVREQRERLDELAEDVSLIGLRCTVLEQGAGREQSLTVVGRTNLRSLDELATVLRQELADEVATITERIDTVHRRALRALTDQHGGKEPA